MVYVHPECILARLFGSEVWRGRSRGVQCAWSTQRYCRQMASSLGMDEGPRKFAAVLLKFQCPKMSKGVETIQFRSSKYLRATYLLPLFLIIYLVSQIPGELA